MPRTLGQTMADRKITRGHWLSEVPPVAVTALVWMLAGAPHPNCVGDVVTVETMPLKRSYSGPVVLLNSTAPVNWLTLCRHAVPMLKSADDDDRKLKPWASQYWPADSDDADDDAFMRIA